MKRWVLLGIEDSEVDVLSKLSHSASPSDIVVYHPDPGALVLQLAELAEFRAVDRPPEPRSDDVLVISSHPGSERWEDAWRRVGARVLTSRAVGVNGEEQEEGEVQEPQVSAVQPAVADDSDFETSADGSNEIPSFKTNDISSVGEGRTMEEFTSETGGQDVATMDSHSGDQQERGRSSGSMPEGMTPDVWSDPHTTFRYLMAESGAERYTLWWDGENDTWVPLAWSGSLPEPISSGSRPEGLEISHRWGRFILTGAEEGRLHRPALARVAEDMALRDLEEWRRSGDRLAVRLPSEEPADLPAWGRWLDEALPVLGAEAALLWLRQEGAWRLARAWGEGVGLAGELRLPEPLFAATFGPASMWRSWQPFPGYRILFTPRSGDHAWPLRQARLHHLLSAANR